MKDYYAILGLACVDADFREALLDQGFAAVAARGLIADLTTADQAHLNDFKNAPPAQKEQARQGFGAAGIGVAAVCQTPPCPYSP
jgi:hypothetical protein